MRISSAILTAMICAATLCNACGDYNSNQPYTPPENPPGNPPVAAGEVSIALPTTVPFVATGEIRSVVATVRDLNGFPIFNPTVTWTTTNAAVATVAGTGAVATITAVDDGTAILSAISGGIRCDFTVIVRRALTSIEVTVPLSSIPPSNTTQLTAVGRDPLGHVIAGVNAFTFTTSNPNSVAVSPTGLVTALIPAGAVTINASATRDNAHATGYVVLAVAQPVLTFDFASLMSGDDKFPVPVQTGGQGVTYMRLNGNRISYLTIWAGLTGFATGAWIREFGTNTEHGRILALLEEPSSTTNWGILNSSFGAEDIRPFNGQPPISMDSVLVLFRRGKAYVEVTTIPNASGEIGGLIEGPLRQQVRSR